MRHLLAVLVLLGCSVAKAESVVPNFTRGTVDSTTTTTTKVTENIRIVEYTTGNSYTVTGHNINIPGNPQPGANYTIQTQGAPFQFSETILGPGIARETWLERTTDQQSLTHSLSVFTQ
jgi:hypothetical protein